jgi:hypothetical protein
MFMQNWSVKAEYLYVNLGSFTYADPCITPIAVSGTPFPTYSTRVSTREHVARVGINYPFRCAGRREVLIAGRLRWFEKPRHLPGLFFLMCVNS